MPYTRDKPKWVQAERVQQDWPGYVTVTAYGEMFTHCRVEWTNPARDKTKSDVLVQNSQGDWLRVWFYDADVIA